jgi:NAD(P)-dependent dehydrogenase (short-subunit alcohol dehydrogenase family)
MNLEGSKVIIFGGTSGIGLATASLAAQSGANVVIVGRDPDRLAGALAKLPPGTTGTNVDAVIALPSRNSSGTPVPLTIWFFRSAAAAAQDHSQSSISRA